MRIRTRKRDHPRATRTEWPVRLSAQLLPGMSDSASQRRLPSGVDRFLSGRLTKNWGRRRTTPTKASRRISAIYATPAPLSNRRCNGVPGTCFLCNRSKTQPHLTYLWALTHRDSCTNPTSPQRAPSLVRFAASISPAVKSLRKLSVTIAPTHGIGEAAK